MIEDWKSYNWGDISELKYGKGLKGYRDLIGDVPVYGTNGYIGQTDNPLCLSKGIIVGRKGAYRGIHYSPVPFYVIDTAYFLLPTIENLNIKYAYYQLLTQDINGLDSGSAIPSTSRDDFYRLKVNLPPLPEQRAIASILSALDDKIELNLQMNKTLEDMAMTLYKHWFVDFGPFQEGEMVDSELGEIPKGWEVKTLEDLSKVKGGKRLPKGSQLQTKPNEHPYIRVRDFESAFFTRSGLEYVPDQVFDSISNYIVHANDIVLTIVGTIGKVALIADNLNKASLTENCVKISITEKELLPELLFVHLISRNGQNEIKSKTVGSTQPKLPIYNIKSLRLALPLDFIVIEEPSVKLQNYFRIIYNNLLENQTLTTLRDTLLPKLISGEVRVKEAENIIIQAL